MDEILALTLIIFVLVGLPLLAFYNDRQQRKQHGSRKRP